MNRSLKILFISARFPYPLVSGDRVKIYYLLKHLSTRHDVSLISFRNKKHHTENDIRHLESLGIDVRVVDHTPPSGALSTLMRLGSPLPLECRYFMTPAFYNTYNTFINNNNVDLGISYFLRMAELQRKANYKKLLISDDYRTLYMKRSYMNTKNSLQRAVRYWEFRKLLTYEPDLKNDYDAVTYTTKRDLAESIKFSSANNYFLLNNGVDTKKFAPSNSYAERKNILFAGKLNLWANILSIRLLVNEIMPLILKNNPETKLIIAGAEPTKEILSLNSKHIEVHTDIESLQPYYSKAKLMIHPHFAGTGVQNKTLEALSCGLPVVTTTIGNQGIEATHGREIMIGNSSEAITMHALSLLNDDKFAESISVNARGHVLRKHSWENSFTQLDNIIENVMW